MVHGPYDSRRNEAILRISRLRRVADAVGGVFDERAGIHCRRESCGGFDVSQQRCLVFREMFDEQLGECILEQVRGLSEDGPNRFREEVGDTVDPAVLGRLLVAQVVEYLGDRICISGNGGRLHVFIAVICEIQNLFPEGGFWCVPQRGDEGLGGQVVDVGGLFE